MILNDFKQQISSIINNSGLSIEAIYYVLKDIFIEIEKLYFLELQKEQKEANKEKEDEIEPDNK